MMAGILGGRVGSVGSPTFCRGFATRPAHVSCSVRPPSMQLRDSAFAGDKERPERILLAQSPDLRVEGIVGGEHHLQMQVRMMELDHYGVVGNAVFPQYFLHGRYTVLAALGFRFDLPVVTTLGGVGVEQSEANVCDVLVVTTKQTISYLKPLRANDQFIIRSHVISVGGTQFEMCDQIFLSPPTCAANHSRVLDHQGSSIPHEQVLVAYASVTFACVTPGFKPRRIPQKIKANMLEMKQQYDEHHMHTQL